MTAREAFGMREERVIEHLLAGGVEPRRLAGVHGHRRHVADVGVPMGVIIPGEEPLTERTGVFDGVKARRKVGLVLEGLELRFRVWIVIADMGPAVALGDTKASKSATGLERIEVPRSACRVSCPRAMPCRRWRR
jgi:hypothetical protein